MFPASAGRRERRRPLHLRSEFQNSMNLLMTIAWSLIGAVSLLALLYLIWRVCWGPPGQGQVPILAYHRVDGRFELGGTWNTPGQFRRQMLWLKNNGYRTVTMSQAAEMMERREKAERTVCITFDDAYLGLYHHVLPVLRECGFTATVFVVAGFVGRDNAWDINWGGRRFQHLGWDQLREMLAAGMEIGSHSLNHRDLRHLNDDELEREVAESRRILEQGLGARVAAFAYPFGLYNERVRRQVRDAGYACACSVSPARKNAVFDKYALRRTGVYITDVLWDFRNKIDHAARWFWLQDLWTRVVNCFSRASALIQRLMAAVKSFEEGRRVRKK